MAPHRDDPANATSAHGNRPPASHNGVVAWLFRNRVTGQMTVAQFPNPALWGFLGLLVLSWVLPSGSTAASAARGVALAFLSWWAVDEIARGVNPWRRLLGAGAAVWIVLMVAQRLA